MSLVFAENQHLVEFSTIIKVSFQPPKRCLLCYYVNYVIMQKFVIMKSYVKINFKERNNNNNNKEGTFTHITL